MMRFLLLSLAALTAFGIRSSAASTRQAGTAESYREVVAVYITMRDCCSALTPMLRGPIEQLKGRFKIQATRESASFRSVGVALDWTPDDGWAHLKEFGPFDEIAVGGNWYGLSAENLVWRDSTVAPTVPQLMVFEHQVIQESDRRVRFGPRRVLRSESGPKAIAAWAERCTRNIASPCY